ncbi:MAG: PhoD-like phosphatase [Coleofasciculaceae cyanobacterium]
MPLDQNSARLHHLPLILAGPILRHTECDSVTVWVALKSSRQVTLNVYATDDHGSIIKTPLLKGSRTTVAFGKHLHIVAVTAKPINENQLEAGQIYAYNLSFDGEENLSQALNSPSISPVTISYFEHQLPTFSLPPNDLNHLRIAHGSCRKLHGGGQDAVPMLDDLINHHATQPNSRLHQLFFTGDQIYGDDVADPLLWLATDLGDTLLGWQENLPFSSTQTTDYQSKKPQELLPGQRTEIAREYAGFTAMLIDTPHESKSHLFSLGEYFATYLLAWSPILWLDLPQGRDIYKDSKQAKSWDKEAGILKDCLDQLWKVRRALANVPVYMICDDHDISDDWYLNQAWCTGVLSKPLGKRAVQNGLFAYAIFQAWGNTPQQFEAGQTGETLLQAAEVWSASAGTNQLAEAAISKCLGLPQISPETGLPEFRLDEDVLVLDRNYPDGMLPLEWHYTIRSPKHEVIVLDTRTWRGYPQADDLAPPMLLSPTAFIQQIEKPLEMGKTKVEVTFVVVPTNLVSLQIIDIFQKQELEKGNVFNSDVGDAWNFHEAALSRLLAELFKRRTQVVILSGDIHYAGAVSLNYWSTEQQNSQAKVLAQLTSSALKNGETKTYFIHTKAKSLALEPPQDWLGWHKPPQLVEIQMIQEIIKILDVEVPEVGPVVRQLKGGRGNWDIAWEIALKNPQAVPDWQYHIEWIKRQQARFVPWKEKQVESFNKHQNSSNLLENIANSLSILWQNKWVQEGEEVVGRSNFGVVSLQWSDADKLAKAVIQDTYWRSTWQSNSIVYSRYFVPLQTNQLPPPIRSITN